ncbi:putative adhesin [Roseomonas fluvialis]|uniref:Putative adhesin Stv domain-containing protein n=1 Tax=Roseomonas fluvialis TaxID=1750527 RepID=A0ABN6NY08_9PROT|nr:hypothetical protein [Roseomonas fluvialis]BDG70249.1 hypothetical protein Rmf_01780 [Roseomonas fluvialis]
MADIYLCGHGEWKTNGVPSGFANVPARTTVHFYTPIGRFLSIDQAMAIMGKGPGALQPDQSVGAYRTVTDLALYPAPEMRVRFMTAALNAGATAVMVDHDSMLSDLLTEYAGHDVHWLACRVRFSGLDTTEGGFNDDYML